MKIEIKEYRYSYSVELNEDGEFRCPHNDPEIEHDIGGDGRTEPGPSWSVYCPDCFNDDMRDNEVDSILENYWDMENDCDE